MNRQSGVYGYPLSRQFFVAVSIGTALIIAVALVAVAHSFHNDGADGIDDPDGVSKWFAPDSVTHYGVWQDNNSCGFEDYVYDQMLWWRADIQQLWANVPDKNYIHEWQTDYRAYEADSWYWTNLPAPDHNEDSLGVEELYDGYEERELGWGTPSVQIPGHYLKSIRTKYYPMFAPCPPDIYETYIYMESELTVPSMIGDWWPEDWDVLGTINTHGVN
jgi:hypothetical protein